MSDTLDRWLSKEWAGLGIAAATLVLGLGLAQLAGAAGNAGVATALRWLAGGSAALLAAGSARHLLQLARVRRDHPPPGRLVDIGGCRLHMLTEGNARPGRPAIVWLPGGHSGAFAMHHLHRALRSDTRSILLDRPGTGWSDTGAFPRSTEREVDELLRALQVAGERGPFVFAGHSFGGLLAANIARRHPAQVHTLVLLDPTPLEVMLVGPRLGALGEMRRNALRRGLCSLFGIDRSAAEERRSRAEPVYARVLDAVAAQLGDAGRSLNAVEAARAGTAFASASIYRELDPAFLVRGDRAWRTVVYDGELGALPVLLVGPKSEAEIHILPEAKAAGTDGAARMARFFGHVRERYLAISSRSQRVVSPPGTGHNFIYETPDFVVQLLRDLVADAAAADAHATAACSTPATSGAP